MRKISLVVGAVGLIGFVACGGDSKPPVASDGSSGSGGKGSAGKSSGGKNSGGEDSAGGEGGAIDTGGKLNRGGSQNGGGADPGGTGGPEIEITSPAAVDDPNEDGVLSGSKVTANCQVTQASTLAASKVDTSSVKLAILDAKGAAIEEKVGVPTGEADEYSAEFALTKVAAGVVGFRCQAEDASKRAGMDKVLTFLDKGPTITFKEPVANSAHALVQPLDIEFTVEAAPLTDDDENAEVDEVALAIAGIPIDLANASDKPGHYRVQVNLADAKLFNPFPDGPTPVTVEATNKRTPAPAKATLEESVAVDGAAPAIIINYPAQKAVVGGTVPLNFTITDKVAGVDPKSIVVSLNMKDRTYDPTDQRWSHPSADVYVYEFDSRQVEGSKVQITVNISANDKVGNISTGASSLLYLDNFPPVLDLDPINVRSIGLAPDAKCSVSFDPVGSKAKNDLDKVVRAGIFRALVADQTNSDPEIPVRHGAGTNPGSVRLYLEADPAKPLLIDKDKDGFCDEVAEIDSANSLALKAVPRAGVPLFGKDDAAPPTSAFLQCTTDNAAPVQTLCTNNASEMWQVIEDSTNHAPIIYAASPTENSLECTGVSWEFGAKVSADGWVCFATRAVDNVGNVGISRPLRLCLDDPERPGTPACAEPNSVPPSCTDNCAPPTRLGGFLTKQ
jgi:hypothetical protein